MSGFANRSDLDRRTGGEDFPSVNLIEYSKNIFYDPGTIIKNNKIYLTFLSFRCMVSPNATAEEMERNMGPCVWLIGRCEKKKEETFRQVVQSRGIPLARCRNLDDLVTHLSCARFPTFLVCGSDIDALTEPLEPHLPAMRADDPRTARYLAAYADCEVWYKAATPPLKQPETRSASPSQRGVCGQNGRSSREVQNRSRRLDGSDPADPNKACCSAVRPRRQPE